ncbi:hypothetical protein ACWEQL_38215 [Kitasatospora sp. NPDC004240]
MTNSRARLTTALALTGALVLAAPALAVAAPAAPGTSATADAGATAGAAAKRSAHRIPFTAANVVQRADGGFTLGWSVPGVRGVTVYAGTDREDIAHRAPVAIAGGTTTVTVDGLPAADRWFFELVSFDAYLRSGLGLDGRDPRDLHGRLLVG